MLKSGELSPPLIRIYSVTPHPLEAFVDQYADRGYDFALTLAGNPEEAKELVQEAFVRAFERWPQYDPHQSFEGWFIGILKNLYRDGLRRYERRHGVSLDAPLEGREDGAFADLLADARDESALVRLERRAASEEVRDALEGLSPEHRAILSLSDMQGLSYEELAEALGCPMGTIRSRLARARKAFRKRMIRLAKAVELE
jgi:RNA polymerase sigma-70 factor, ECF subfamily